jgi:hypothetical protein
MVLVRLGPLEDCLPFEDPELEVVDGLISDVDVLQVFDDRKFTFVALIKTFISSSRSTNLA